MDAGSLTLMHRLISMGATSLLQYASESFPWSADPAHAAVLRVREMAGAEKAEVIRLTRYLQKKRISQPPRASYPSHFTTINFCSLDYLLPKLIAEHESQVAELESKLRLTEDEEIGKFAQAYLDMKRDHLQALRGLAAAKPTAGAA
jgi:hypothetical protein